MYRKISIVLIITVCMFYSSLINLHAQERKRPSVGVVLSGGGAKGFAHIGVLQALIEKGIPIDYICGTSMGSLVGGLYAIGYTPDSIAHIMENADWKSLMSDNIPRDYITYDGREDYDKYLVGLSFARKMKPDLPGGLVKGQNLMLLLNEYFDPVLNITDFTQLKIPYFCVGADIIQGKDVILETGYLPEAIRASIAVPTVFAPVRIDDMLLIDGGFYNNFPTKELKDRGVDIIIGINVGFEAYSTEKLNSVMEVASQLLWINNVKRNIESKEYCDILIEPDLGSISSTSFTDVTSIIQIGKEAALALSNQIDSLANQLVKYNEPARINPDFEASKEPKLKTVSSYKIVGVQNTSIRYLMQNMMIPTDKPIPINKINDGIQRAMGTLNFEHVYYKLLNIDSAYLLDINVKEKKPILLQLGAGYDSDFKPSLRLKVSVRNLFFMSTKFTAKAFVSRYPAAQIQYIYSPEKGLFNNIQNNYSTVGGRINFSTGQIFGYNKDRSRISESTMTIGDIALFYQYYFKEHFMTEIGILNRFAWNHEIVTSDKPRATEMILGVYAELIKDRFNNVSYPTRGDFFKMRVFYDWPYSTTLLHFNIGIFANYSVTIPIGKKVFIYPEIYAGINLRDTLSNSRRIYVGSMNSNSFIDNIKFAGYGNSEIIVNNAITANLNLRWHIVGYHHFLFKSSFGFFSENLFDPKIHQFKAGVGLGYSFDSYIGPLEIVISNSILEKGKPKFWICLGYQF